jgi:hypothetical protein
MLRSCRSAIRDCPEVPIGEVTRAIATCPVAGSVISQILVSGEFGLGLSGNPIYAHVVASDRGLIIGVEPPLNMR